VRLTVKKISGTPEMASLVDGKVGYEVHAESHPDGVAWGVNAARSGVNVLRGVRLPDGRDVAVSQPRPWAKVPP
jgi:hypothetical protein